MPRILAIALAFGLSLLVAGRAGADVFQWEWVDPNDHSQGKQQSSILCPDGAGVVAAPQAHWFFLDLTQAYLYQADLSHGFLNGSALTDAYFGQANLFHALLTNCPLGGADFTQASAAGANFRFSALDNADFSNADLSAATFLNCSMSNTSLSRANLTGAFFNTNLTGVNFTDSTVANARLEGVVGLGFAAAQLYSTASYKNRDLHGIHLGSNDLSGWNFSDMNLATADFSSATLASARFDNATMTHAGFHGANLTGADFSGATLTTADLGGAKLTGATLASANLLNADASYALLTNAECSGARFTGTDLTSADLRGAQNALLVGATTTNAILADGTIEGLRVGPSLIVHNYHGDHPIPIRVTGEMRPPGMTILFDAEPWGSTIGFGPGISVSLEDTGLKLEFEPGIDASTMIGRTFQVFDWTGVSPIGQLYVHGEPYEWDTSHLYSDGTVRLLAVPEPAATLGALCMALRRRR